MGGCRCTYRNCTVRSDGSTHMFHYPVFDKLRCHQWLTNAQRLDFLNLKVSQLKNRVICQNHFTDEYFMNFKKEKLTFDAVPTLDGPFCDSALYNNTNASQAVTKVYPISLDDIEPEHLTLIDKKANFSVKYGDFLTNCEVMDLDPINETFDTKKDVTKAKSFEEIYLQRLYDGNKNSQPNHTGHVTPHPLKQISMPTIVGIQFEDMQNLQVNSINPENSDNVMIPVNSINQKNSDNVMIQVNSVNPKNSDNLLINKMPEESKDQSWSTTFTHSKKDMKVKIISELTLSDPVQLKGKLEPISPSLILRLPDRNNSSRKNEDAEGDIRNTKCHELMINRNRNKSNATEIISLNNVLDSNKFGIEELKSESLTTVLQNIQQPQKTSMKIKRASNGDSASNRSLLKSRIKQERLEEIKDKRKFNMKLRDIIESCLNKIDEPDKTNDMISLKQEYVKENQDKSEQVSSFLAKEPELPSVQEYTMACLEARIKKMESVLVNKIDQNSHRINELKNTFLTSDKKSACTQTATNEESHKRHLYKEISKYLSPDANSLIYEELFINKYSQKVPKCSPSPRKRRRR